VFRGIERVGRLPGRRGASAAAAASACGFELIEGEVPAPSSQAVRRWESGLGARANERGKGTGTGREEPRKDGEARDSQRGLPFPVPSLLRLLRVRPCLTANDAGTGRGPLAAGGARRGLGWMGRHGAGGLISGGFFLHPVEDSKSMMLEAHLSCYGISMIA
jgi:hypothetical protein